jgi:hypothetical protein
MIIQGWKCTCKKEEIFYTIPWYLHFPAGPGLTHFLLIILLKKKRKSGDQRKTYISDYYTINHWYSVTELILVHTQQWISDSWNHSTINLSTPWSIWYLITNNSNPNILLSTYPTPWPIWYLITCILTQLFNLYTYCEGKIPLTQIHDCWWGLANVFHMQVKCQPSHITSL